MGYADSSNLYAFAGGDPVNGRDPTGELCERANSEGWWDWTKRCAQDVGWFAEAANEGLAAPKNVGKNLKRAGGGVVSTVKLVTATVAGAATLAWDAASMSVNDAAADRMVARGQAISNFAANPIDTVVNAHTNAADAILAAEGRGDYVGSGQAAAGIAQADFLAVYGATALGRAAVTRMTPAVVLEEGAYTSGWFAENSLLSASGSPAAVPTAAAFSGGLTDRSQREAWKDTTCQRIQSVPCQPRAALQSSGAGRPHADGELGALPSGDELSRKATATNCRRTLRRSDTDGHQ